MLHLGAHRCASTTFQAYLRANRDRLSKRGLTCWTPHRTRDGLMRGMLRHPAFVTDEDERSAARSTGRLRIEFERLHQCGQTGLLISEENILGTMRNNLLDTRLYPLLRERMMRFSPVFEGYPLRIGLGIRSYDDYWTSSLAYLVARGHAVPSVDLLDFLATQPRRWRDLVRDIAAALPDAEIVVWPFESYANQPERQLALIWDGDCSDLEDHGYWCNRRADLAQLNEGVTLRGEHPINAGLADTGTHWAPFDDNQKQSLRAEYIRDLTWLAEGGDGLAYFANTPDSAAKQTGDARSTHASLLNGGQIMPVDAPDRADVIRGGMDNAPPFGGRNDGIKKRMGRPGAS